LNSYPIEDVRLYRMVLPDHPCPWGLKAVALLEQQGIPFEDHHLTSEAEVEAFKRSHSVVTTPQIFFGDHRIGGYSDLAAILQVKPEALEVSYTPVIAVFGSALLVTLAAGLGWRGFMGLAIAMLAMLKLMDIPGFAKSYSKYDLLTQRWPAYGRLYPGLEMVIALGFLANAAMGLTGVLAVLVGISGMVSVYKAVVIDKLALNCACVGGNSKAPLGIVSFAENGMMALMGVAMLLGS
jgi:glutaredoxin